MFSKVIPYNAIVLHVGLKNRIMLAANN